MAIAGIDLNDKFYCIYKITNLINNKFYIGKTCNFAVRIKYHKTRSFITHPNTPLVRAFKKYGINNFKFEVIKGGISSNHINDVEKQYIKKLKCQDPKIGYNILAGGDGWSKGNIPWNKGTKGLVIISEETRKKISLANTGKNKIFTQQHKNNIALATKLAMQNPAVKEKLAKPKKINYDKLNKKALNKTKLILDKVNSNFNLYEIAKQLNITPSSVINQLKRTNMFTNKIINKIYIRGPYGKNRN